jgi:hypothetical protein
MDLDGYRTVENFLKKLNQLEEYYIDSKANEILTTRKQQRYNRMSRRERTSDSMD